MNNSNLHKAKKAKDDEFYTKYSDIKDEMQYYKNHLKGKIIYCNCDDYRWSNFVKYFKDNFRILGLSGLYATNYDNGNGAYKYYYDGISEVIKKLNGNGSYASEECLEILKIADLVISNPPFSLWRHYFKTLMDNNKKFIILGNPNAITYKEIFPLIKDNKLWLGYTSPKEFIQPDGDEPKSMTGLTRWFTNLETKKRKEDLLLYKKYNTKDYPKYDNYDAVNVDKVKDIPMDYYGVMGVPITFLDSYNPEQFEIVALGNSRENFTPNKTYLNPKKVLKNGNIINGNAINCVLAIEVENKPTDIHYTSDNSKYLIAPYARVLIKRK